MDSRNGGAEPPRILSTEGFSKLGEGVSLVLSRWTALLMAVVNQWGGPQSRGKADELVADILSWFTLTKPPLYIDDLEALMYERMLDSFNSEVEDGSVEEVAEQLMILHEDCLKGNYESIQKLKQLDPPKNSVSQSQRMVNEGDDYESSEEGEEEEMESDTMDVDEGMKTDPSRSNSKPVPDPEGWTTVSNKRNNKGRKSN